MNRLISIFLIISIITAGFGSVIYFSLVSSFIHYEVRSKIQKKNINLISLSFSKNELSKNPNILIFKKSDEFKYAGNMYDIKKIIENKDSIIYICHKDDKETKLIHNYTANQEKSESKHKSQILTNLFQLSLILYNCEINTKSIRQIYPDLTCGYIIHYINLYKSVISEISTPPPELLIQIK